MSGLSLHGSGDLKRRMRSSGAFHAVPAGMLNKAPVPTLVEQVVEAIVRAAAMGDFLPGDRVVEAELARRFNVSRVPVREALRILESQGIVVSTLYRGVRMMEVDPARLQGILEVRIALESLAIRIVLDQGSEARLRVLAELDAVIEQMRVECARGNSYEMARLDTEFHRTLCRASGNAALLAAWEPLARQLTIIFGLATMHKPLRSVITEHEELRASIASSDLDATASILRAHMVYEPELMDLSWMEGRRRAVEGAV